MSIYATMKTSRTMDSSDAASTWMETDTTHRSVLVNTDHNNAATTSIRTETISDAFTTGIISTAGISVSSKVGGTSGDGFTATTSMATRAVKTTLSTVNGMVAIASGKYAHLLEESPRNRLSLDDSHCAKHEQ